MFRPRGNGAVQPSDAYQAEIRNELAGHEMKRAKLGMDGYDTFTSALFRLGRNVGRQDI